MTYLVFIHALNGLLMIAMPICLAIYLIKHWKLTWGIWWIGVATFTISQVGHIPFNWGVGILLDRTGIVYWSPIAQQVFNAAFLGLSAGLFEEVARYIVLRFWLKSARSWRTGILFGAGHGGGEAIILGVLVLVTYISMLVVRNMDVSSLVPASQLKLAQEQITTYWSSAWYDSLLGALERLFTIPVQIVMAVIVMQVFTRKQIRWLFLAILFHAIVDGLVVFLMPKLGIYWTEILVGVIAIISIGILMILRQPEPIIEPISSPFKSNNPSTTPKLTLIDESIENLENTRYQK